MELPLLFVAPMGGQFPAFIGSRFFRNLATASALVTQEKPPNDQATQRHPSGALFGVAGMGLFELFQIGLVSKTPSFYCRMF